MDERFDKMYDNLNINVSHEKDENRIHKDVLHCFGFNSKEKRSWNTWRSLWKINYGFKNGYLSIN